MSSTNGAGVKCKLSTKQNQLVYELSEHPSVQLSDNILLEVAMERNTQQNSISLYAYFFLSLSISLSLSL